MLEQVGWKAHPKFEHWAQPFEDHFQMVDMLKVGDTSFEKKRTRKQEGRHCIFCSTSYPDTTFKNAPHLLSRMMGNINLYSTFECDACNNKFSLYETDLAYFLGAGRSISGMRDNKKAPGFPGIGMETKSIIFKGKKLMVMHNENAQRNIEEASTILPYKKPTYTPANVYKIFLKCALSLLPQEEVVSKYKSALEFLLGGKVLLGAQAYMFRFPLSVKIPLHVYIFKKTSDEANLPVYVASFYFDNLVITCPVWLHQDDLKILNQEIKFPMPPPYFIYGTDLLDIEPFFSIHDLGSPDKLKNEPEEMKMEFDKSKQDKVFRYDLKTGEGMQTAYNPTGSKYFITTEPGTTFTKEEWIELLTLIEQKFAE